MIISIWKPKGLSSLVTYSYIKRHTKIGHLGTLDMYAEGVLVLLTGRSTKYQNDLHKLPKEYFFSGILGFDTNSDDMCGRIKNSKKIDDYSEEDLKHIADFYRGSKHLQRTPGISAKKIKGVAMYKMEEDKREDRFKEVEVYEISLFKSSYCTFYGYVKCSEGFYIRSLVRDIGSKMKTIATTLDICRIGVGSFNVSNSIKIFRKHECTKGKRNKRFN